MSEVMQFADSYIAPVGAAGMNGPRGEYLNHFYQEFGDYFYLAANTTEALDYRLYNGCMCMISLIDSIAKQRELKEHYAQYREGRISAFCESTGRRINDLSEADIIYLEREASNRVVGEVVQWFSRKFPIHRPNVVGVCRGPPGYDEHAKWETKPPAEGEYQYNIAKVYAEIITSKIELDVSQMTIGFRGSGKSSKDTVLGERTAAWVSYIKDGDPTLKGSRNYYNEDTIAVITLERVDDVVNDKSPGIIKQFDDVAAKAWNSRNYASKANKDKNADFQINRVARQAQFFSFPDLFVFDKVPRSMCSHLCEMQKDTVAMREKIEHSQGKLFLVDKKFREDKPLYVFPVFNNSLVCSIVYPKCSKEMQDWYAEERKKASLKLTPEEKAEREGWAKEQEKITKKHQEVLNKFDTYVARVQGGEQASDVLRDMHIAKNNIRYWDEKGYVKSDAWKLDAEVAV